VDDIGPFRSAAAAASASEHAASADPTARGRRIVAYRPNTTSAPWSVGMLANGSPYSTL
jgi:hypothetical protein